MLEDHIIIITPITVHCMIHMANPITVYCMIHMANPITVYCMIHMPDPNKKFFLKNTIV